MRNERRELDAFELVLLERRDQEDLLEEFYRRVYLPAFPIRSEREKVTTWKELLWGGDDSCKLHVLIAGIQLKDRRKRRLIAGHLFEFYPVSRCGLMTYLVVHPSYRGLGIGRRLFERGIRILEDTARQCRSQLRAVFAEVNNPRRIRRHQDVIDPRVRLAYFRALGGRVLDIPYVQPELEPGQGRARDLLLLWMFPPLGNRRSIPAGPVFDFLCEFYQAVERLNRDRDFRRMLAAGASGRILLKSIEDLTDRW